MFVEPNQKKRRKLLRSEIVSPLRGLRPVFDIIFYKHLAPNGADYNQISGALQDAPSPLVNVPEMLICVCGT